METQNIIIPPESLFEALIRYGLYLGAGFQLMCLAACVLLPGNSNGSSKQKVSENFQFEGSIGQCCYAKMSPRKSSGYNSVNASMNVLTPLQSEDNEDSESELSTPKKPAPASTHHRRKVDKKKRR